MKYEREIEEARQKKEAQARANLIWSQAMRCAEHPYLTEKQVKEHGARRYKGALVVPMYAEGELHSLQFIAADGTKKFLTGGRVSDCYYSIGNLAGSPVICVVEGFATGASIHEATQHPVAVAFNASNLEAVARALREKFPEVRLILCADDDYATPGNPGLTKAREAAFAVDGLLAVPDFGNRRPEGVTDFNDLARLYGAEAVKRAIKNAAKPEVVEGQLTSESATISGFQSAEWEEPQSLTAKVDLLPYPLEALPPTIRAAVEEVATFVKAPLPVVASSALAALSLAIQPHVDVKRAEKLSGPVGLFLLTIADSGERKSTCDGFFMKAIRDYEQAQAEAAKPILNDYHTASKAWEAKRNGVLEQIKQLAKRGKPTSDLESDLHKLEREQPKAPRIPRLLYADATPEALAYGLAKHWPSAGVISAEAGIVLGSHGMSKDSAMRNLAMLNQLWDGNTVTIDRKTTDSFSVREARLTVALQVQEAAMREFFGRSGTLARGTGFLARFLLSWPESTQGLRPFTEAPENWPYLAAFNQRLTSILNEPLAVDEDGILAPLMLTLTPDAKAAWVEHHNEVEQELVSGGDLYEVRDVASKSADNAARLAALFQMFEHGMGQPSGWKLSRQQA
jgi:putative DNA primase/helicase